MLAAGRSLFAQGSNPSGFTFYTAGGNGRAPRMPCPVCLRCCAWDGMGASAGALDGLLCSQWLNWLEVGLRRLLHGGRGRPRSQGERFLRGGRDGLGVLLDEITGL